MKAIDKLLLLVQDESLGIDDWSDVFVIEAIKLAETLSQPDEIEKCLQIAPSLDPNAQIRLYEVICSLPLVDMFMSFVPLLSHGNIEIAEVIFDGLRFWPLEPSQKKELLSAIHRFRGRSKLLDLCIDNFSSSII